MAIIVKDKAGVFIREYSEEVHGSNFKELAEQFAESNGHVLSVTKENTMSEEENKVEETPTEAPAETTPESTPEETATETPAETAAPEAQA